MIVWKKLEVENAYDTLKVVSVEWKEKNSSSSLLALSLCRGLKEVNRHYFKSFQLEPGILLVEQGQFSVDKGVVRMCLWAKVWWCMKWKGGVRIYNSKLSRCLINMLLWMAGVSIIMLLFSSTLGPLVSGTVFFKVGSPRCQLISWSVSWVIFRTMGKTI